MPKESSTEVTCLMRALDVADSILSSRGLSLPEHLIIEAFSGWGETLVLVKW